jgi:signal transduction histidine kinase
MDRVISELLAFAKPTVLNKDRVDLNKIIKETVASVTGESGPARVTINADDQVFVMADDVLLRQALSNILINAIEAVSEGGEIIVDLNRLHDNAQLSIRDTGSGIPEKILQKIFLPFFTTRQEGVGLGLALVQKIIFGHGWSIEVESREGEGAAFLITIPSIE